jgi:hypothetical protein
VLRVIQENLVLAEIAKLAREGKFVLTEHARLRADARRMTTPMIKDVLINPERLIRIDIGDDGPVYKIQGGRYRRKLAVAIVRGWLRVVTVM